MTLALITGGSGLVGSNLTRALLDDGYKLDVLILIKIIELLKVLMLSLLMVI